MTENEKTKRLRLQDCKIDWEHYPTEEMDGSITIEDKSSDKEQILHEWMEDCECDEFWKANMQKCRLYHIYSHELDSDKYAVYAQQEHYSDSNIAFWGLSAMFNDGWLKSPAFVDWKEMWYCVSQRNINNFLSDIYEPQRRVELLTYLIKNAEFIYGEWKKEVTPKLKELLETHKAAAKIRKEELKRQAAEERVKNKTKKEKPEYILSVEEIIQFVREENPDAAPAIRGMLRYFADEKEGWNSKVIKALLEPIKAQNFNFYAPVENAIGNVEHINTKNE